MDSLRKVSFYPFIHGQPTNCAVAEKASEHVGQFTITQTAYRGGDKTPSRKIEHSGRLFVSI